MAGTADDPQAINWHKVLEQLLRRNTVAIPCADAAELEHRAAQAADRAQKRGLPVAITQAEGMLHLSLDPEAARQFRQQRKARRAARRGEQQPT